MGRLKNIPNPAMVVIRNKAFRKWVTDRFDTMTDDSSWVRDNPALVPQFRRIAYQLNHDQPISRADVKAIVEELNDFEDVLTTPDYRPEWQGAKEFLIHIGEVREFTEEDDKNITVSRGTKWWFRHGGKKYISVR